MELLDRQSEVQSVDGKKVMPMSCVKLYQHQEVALTATKDKNRVAFYHDM